MDRLIPDGVWIKDKKGKHFIQAIKEAFKNVDLSHRGSDEEYAQVVNEEAETLEPYRKRAEEREALDGPS